jgi:hypothetical protein
MRGTTTVSLAILAALALGAPVVSRAGELTVAGSWSRGDYGTGDDVDSEALALRYVSGKTLVVRAELPWLNVQSEADVVRTGAGSSRYAGRGVGEGPGSGGGDGESAGAEIVRDSGVGDLLLGVTRTVAGGGVRRLRVDAGAEVKVPTADESAGLGTGEWDVRIGGSGEYRWWSVTSFWGAGWNRLGDPPWIELNDVADVYLGLEGSAFGERIVVSGWLEGRGEIVDGEGAAGLAGVELRALRGPRWRAAVTAGFGGGIADVAVTVGYSHVFGKDAAGFRGVLR